MLKVGISEVNITPAPGLRMSGMLNPPKAEGVQWPLFGRTFIFDDGASRAAVVCLDLLFLLSSTVAEVRQAITAGTGLAPTDVMITCTHTHRGPYTTGIMEEDVDLSYVDFVRARLVEGMAQAWAARQPARLWVGRANAPGWTFNRRQVYRTDLGEQVGTQGPEWVDEFVRREGPEDHELRVLRVDGQDGKSLGGLVNFACHTTVMGGQPVYSADFAGALTETLSGTYGGVFGFLQGAAGNLWSVDKSAPDKYGTFGGPEHNQRMGDALAEKAREALAGGHEACGSGVRTARRVLRIPQRCPTKEQVELAQWYLEEAPDKIDEHEFTRRIYGRAHTFYGNDPVVQKWFARQLIGMWEWQRLSGAREPAEDVEVQAIAVGDVALVGYPAEYFTEFGLKTKAESPFAATFVAELANGWHGYVPTFEAFARGGYEARLGYTSRLIPEAGDLMCDAALKLLFQLAR